MDARSISSIAVSLFANWFELWEFATVPICNTHRRVRRGDIDRRAFLVASGIGIAGMCEQPARAAPPEKLPAGRATAKSTIMIWLNGGPSHIDLWDMKPAAPREIRGDFQPIATSAPGISLCEHLPHLARQAHHLALVKSLGQHGRGPNDHHPGFYYNLTGHPPGESFPNSRLALADDWPFVGSVVAHKLPAHPSLPSLVWLPTKSGENGVHRPGAIAARLGVQHDPLYVEGKHSAPLDFRSPALTLEGDVTVETLQSRQELLKTLSNAERDFERSASVRNSSQHQRKALSLLSSQGSKTAFDVSREPESVRQKYGHTINSSDRIGAYPAERPVGPEHIVHTIYHAMGIHDLEAIDSQNRPYNLLEEGKPLVELF